MQLTCAKDYTHGPNLLGEAELCKLWCPSIVVSVVESTFAASKIRNQGYSKAWRAR